MSTTVEFSTRRVNDNDALRLSLAAVCQVLATQYRSNSGLVNQNRGRTLTSLSIVLQEDLSPLSVYSVAKEVINEFT